MTGWRIGPPAPTPEQLQEIVKAERVNHRRQHNKAARKARRTNRRKK